MVQVRDLTSWATGARATLAAALRVRDAASAQAARAEHDALRAQVDAREDSFRRALAQGERLVAEGNPNAAVRLLLLPTMSFREFRNPLGTL